ncbi:MAG: LptF/LptG family permease, partial [Victivallaceae bacterium]|nr:LptF/LptG family permease [Victivallaceae bacterium]
CGGAIFVVGLAVTAVDVWFNEALVPYTERRASQVMDAATGKRSYDGFLTYRSDDGARQWLFKTFTDRDEQTDVVLKTVWTRSMLDQLLFRNGRIDREAVRRYFPEQAETMLKLPDAELERTVVRELNGRMTDLVIDHAVYDFKTKTWHFKKGRVTSFDRGTAGLGGSAGTSIMHDEVPFESMDFAAAVVPESPIDIGNAVKDKEELPTFTIGKILRNNPELADRAKRIYRTIFFYRIAFPWSCFLAVFLGIPLATKNERTGSLMAIITAVLIIVVYLVTAQIFLVLGKNGTLNPAFAGLAPTVAFVLYGIGRIYYDRN